MKKWILFLKDKWKDLMISAIAMLIYINIFASEITINLDQTSKYIFGGILSIFFILIIYMLNKEINKRY